MGIIRVAIIWVIGVLNLPSPAAPPSRGLLLRLGYWWFVGNKGIYYIGITWLFPLYQQ